MININYPERDEQAYQSFIHLLADRLCGKCRFLSRNRGFTEFVFSIEDIPKEPSRETDLGFGITSIKGNMLNKWLSRFAQESGFIQIHLIDGRFCLTKKGIRRCKEERHFLKCIPAKNEKLCS
jgi:hypothetical protein